MPDWVSPSVNHQHLARCRDQVRGEMLAANWVSGQEKFNKVLERRAWKLYQRTVTCR